MGLKIGLDFLHGLAYIGAITSSKPTKEIPMTSTPTPTPSEASKAQPASAKVQKTISSVLTDASGNQLRINGTRRANGGYSTSVSYYEKGKDGKLKYSQRGASEQHADEDTARKAIKAITDTAAKQGWSQKRPGGFAGKADSFNLKTLPKGK